MGEITAQVYPALLPTWEEHQHDLAGAAIGRALLLHPPVQQRQQAGVAQAAVGGHLQLRLCKLLRPAAQHLRAGSWAARG